MPPPSATVCCVGPARALPQPALIPAPRWLSARHRSQFFSRSCANDTTGSVAAANLLTLAAGMAGVSAGVLFALSAKFPGHQDWSLALLYDVVIPGLALAALLITTMLLVRASARGAARACQPRRRAALTPGSRRLAERFGRKSNLVAASSMLFAFSCFYRAVNIADEGAATCRGAPSPFNAPAAGRFVATVGEVALVVQVAVYVEETARRLGASRGLWAAVRHGLACCRHCHVTTAHGSRTASHHASLTASLEARSSLVLALAAAFCRDGGRRSAALLPPPSAPTSPRPRDANHALP